MYTITIDEVVNGFVVRAYDPKEGYALNEFHERYVDVLSAIKKLTDEKIVTEFGRLKYAATM